MHTKNTITLEHNKGRVSSDLIDNLSSIDPRPGMSNKR